MGSQGARNCNTVIDQASRSFDRLAETLNRVKQFDQCDQPMTSSNDGSTLLHARQNSVKVASSLGFGLSCFGETGLRFAERRFSEQRAGGFAAAPFVFLAGTAGAIGVAGNLHVRTQLV